MEVDVTNVEGTGKMMERARDELGGLDILVNNAGVNVHKKALDITPEDFNFVVRVNLQGVFFCCQAAARIMIPAKKGKLLTLYLQQLFWLGLGSPFQYTL